MLVLVLVLVHTIITSAPFSCRSPEPVRLVRIFDTCDHPQIFHCREFHREHLDTDHRLFHLTVEVVEHVLVTVRTVLLRSD